MRLKGLELAGYKTFAARSDFLFDAGITAIVGPNGSGKSNIADALRWVLGEQSFSLLRAKRSEDMIFAGSARRARVGMAEATLTLDNSDQWLPVDFSEVAITRRCYRSGENEYLLNGSQVRLRDITDLLAQSGLARRTYTVIGQGLVDAALSLRPQERRTLIEEAAGLTLYQSRRADALNKLDETTSNVLRVHDLTAEISPRLDRLKRQAERAQEHALIRQELDGALRVWYGYQWQRGQDELHRRRAIEEYQLGRLEAQRERLSDLSKQITLLRRRQGDLRDQLSTWHRESSNLHTRSEALQRELAVLEERRRGLIGRRKEIFSEIAPLEANLEAQEQEVATTQADLAVLLAELTQHEAAVEQAQAALDAHREQLSRLLAAQTTAREHLLSIRVHITDSKNRQAQMVETSRQVLGEIQDHQAACSSLQERLDALRVDLKAVEEDQRALADEIAQAAAERTSYERQIGSAQERRQDLERQRSDLDGRAGRLQERYALLTRMRREGAGLYDGVRSVLRLAREAEDGGRHLAGILGTVAELIQVPRELETAIEVALAGQLQSIVVESWQDAQAAIDHLKRTREGRATFLPLDTLRATRPIQLPNMAGVVGLASALVACEARTRSVVEHLLGTTIICQDLTTARRVLDAQSGTYQIVTPEGELARSSGAVTGGSIRQQRGGGILAREREWRELPAQLQALKKDRQLLTTSIQQEDAKAAALREQLDVLMERQERLESTHRQALARQAQVQQEVAQVERELDWHRSLLSDAEQELSQTREREETLRQETQALGSQAEALETRLADLQAQIDDRDDEELDARLADCRATVALTRQRQAGKQVELQGYERSRHQIVQQLTYRRRQLDDLTDDLSATEAQIEEKRVSATGLSVEIQSYADRIRPTEQELAEQERQQAELEEQEGSIRTRLQALEAQYSRVRLQVARQEDRMDNLRQQIETDLGLVELDMGDDLSGQPLLPLGPLVSSLPRISQLPEGLETQINALKRRMHHLEPINPDAPAEYAELNRRHEFLSGQAQDLEQAIADLRQVIAELDAVMEREFRRTFDVVAREFRAYFEQLFGGGSAHLQLTDPEDLMSTGIDIVARPPGKRQQGLALLSGGERALTAAALVFAILTASPTPFCVLDEVDAALDEANVGRFRSVLRSLACETQFVIITHNRYTIEFADIVYGISMNADGSSCVISRRLKQSSTDTVGNETVGDEAQDES
jgi:chromosome segregation protein